jgi:hypothetical protein
MKKNLESILLIYFRINTENPKVKKHFIDKPGGEGIIFFF